MPVAPPTLEDYRTPVEFIQTIEVLEKCGHGPSFVFGSAFSATRLLCTPDNPAPLTQQVYIAVLYMRRMLYHAAKDIHQWPNTDIDLLDHAVTTAIARIALVTTTMRIEGADDAARCVQTLHGTLQQLRRVAYD